MGAMPGPGIFPREAEKDLEAPSWHKYIVSKNEYCALKNNL